MLKILHPSYKLKAAFYLGNNLWWKYTEVFAKPILYSYGSAMTSHQFTAKLPWIEFPLEEYLLLWLH